MAEETGQTITESPVAAVQETLLTEAPAPEVPGEVKDATTKGEVQTPKEDAKPELGVPEKYEFKLPEGMDFDTEAFKPYEPVFKKLGLNNEQAQELVDLFAQQESSKAQALSQKLATQHEEWIGAVQSDPELGGKNFENTKKNAQKAMARYGTDSLRALFQSTGLGSHPDLVRMYNDVGKSMAEDSITTGKTSVAVSDPALRIFTTMNK